MSEVLPQQAQQTEAQPSTDVSSPKLEASGQAPTEATQHMTLPTPETLAENEFADKTVYDFKMLNCYKELYDLGQHRGSVLLIVNVASNSSGFTEPCYRVLTSLYKKYHLQGLEILAFPCNQFGGGETGNADEIAESLSTQFPSLGDIEFPIMAKVDVNGDHELPLYSFLKSRIKGTLGQSSIKWNFTYFLVDRNGLPVARFAADTSQDEIEKQIRALLTNETAAEAPPPSAEQAPEHRLAEPRSPVDPPRTTTPSDSGDAPPQSYDSIPTFNATSPGENENAA